MSNHKRISKKRNEKKAVSDKQNIEKFIEAFGEMAKGFRAVASELNKIRVGRVAEKYKPGGFISEPGEEIIQGRNKHIDFVGFRNGLAARLNTIEQKEIIIVGDNYPLPEFHAAWAWRNNIPEILQQMNCSAKRPKEVSGNFFKRL